MGPFEPLLTLGIQATVKWVILQGPAVLRIVAVLSLVACLGTGWSLYRNVSQADDLLFGALGAKQEDINQPNGGLQAVLLSEFDKGIDTFKREATVSSDFVTLFHRIEQQLVADPVTSTPLTVMRSGGDRIINLFFSDKQSGANNAAFLFIPAYTMRGGKSLTGSVSTSTGTYSDKELLDALGTDASLTYDINHTANVSTDVCSLNGTIVFEAPQIAAAGDFAAKNTPVQSYLITSTGALRICESGVKSQEKYYSKRFKATTFFPERNYFLATISADRGLNAQMPIEQAFYVRRPYIDLGGNGVVFSLCKEASLRRRDDSAICMDFAAGQVGREIQDPTSPDATLTKLQKRIESLGGNPVKLHCEGQDNASFVCKDPNGRRRAVIEESMNKYRGDISEVFGKISTDYRTEPLHVGFTIPLAQTGEMSGDLLYADLNISPVRTNTLLRAVGLAVSLIGLIGSIALMIADYGLRLNQQNVAFGEVAAVMQFASDPYCRLDSENKILDYNPSFAEMLGYHKEDSARLTGFSFKDLIISEYKEAYDREIAQRIRGTMSQYPLVLKMADGLSTRMVRVIGAPVPVPHDPSGSKPQTFGIFQPGDVVRDDTKITKIDHAKGRARRDGTAG